MIRLQSVSHIARRALGRGAIAGAAMLTAYLLVVVATTPSLPAQSAIKTALDINSAVIGGTAGAVGAQVFFSSYSKSLGCPIDRKRAIFGAGSGSTAAGSFFSFFSLVPLGCCGSWLFILSLLPAVFGGTLSVFLINYSLQLSYVSLVIVLGFAALAGLRLQRRLKNGSKV